jgi:hypothetical protein
MSEDSEDPLEKWEHDFRVAALADGFGIFRDHLRLTMNRRLPGTSSRRRHAI